MPKTKAEHDALIDKSKNGAIIEEERPVKGPFYLGMNRTDGEDFIWGDGSLLTWTAWGRKEPRSKRNYNCVVLKWKRKQWLWYAEKCTKKRRFICEKGK